MVIQLNVKNPEGIKKGYALVYNGKNWDAIPKEDITKDLLKEIKDLANEVGILKSQVKKAKQDLDAKQKGFLKAFVKEV